MGLVIEKICEVVFARISSYELFNNLLPGAVYAVIVERLTQFRIFIGNVLSDVVMCYVIGLLMGRIGSLVVEELLKKVRNGSWLGRVSYKEYVIAEMKDDGKIQMLSMVNNAYRSLVTTFLCVLFTVIFSLFWPYIAGAKWAIVIVGVILVIVLLCFAYRKQTRYVAERVKAINGKSARKKK